LLRQCQDFNIDAAWKGLIGSAPSSDRLLEWSKEDAVSLKYKLELHKGTPQELAVEVLMLAKSPHTAMKHPGWTTSETDGVILMEPFPSRGWMENSALGLQLSPFSASTEQADNEMSNYI